LSYWKGRNITKAFYAALGIALVLDGLLLLQMVPGALRFTLYDNMRSQCPTARSQYCRWRQ